MSQGTWTTILVTVGLVMGNFLYQAVFGASDWSAAIERSYFGALAVAIVWFCVREEFR